MWLCARGTAEAASVALYMEGTFNDTGEMPGYALSIPFGDLISCIRRSTTKMGHKGLFLPVIGTLPFLKFGNVELANTENEVSRAA